MRSGLKLYKFTSCRTELLPHKTAYFSLLEMLRRIRPHMDESKLEGNMRITFNPAAVQPALILIADFIQLG